MTVEMDRVDVEAMTPAEREPFDAEVFNRVVRFRELEPNWFISPNCALPGFERASFPYIGGGDYLSAEGAKPVPIPRGDNYSCVVVECEPGKGAPLHAHTTEETFIVLSGNWAIYWGENCQHEVVLNEWDAIWFPPPVMRGFRNVGDETAHLLSVIGGGTPPRPIPHVSVVDALSELRTSV